MATQQTFEFLDIQKKAVSTGETTCGRFTPRAESPRCAPATVPTLEKTSLPALPSGETGKPRGGQEAVLRELRAKVGCVSTAPDGDVGVGEMLSTGSEAINRLLPRGGLRPNAITEWVAEADGCGAAALAMITAATHLNSSRGRGPLVVVSGQDNFYPPAAVSLGISANRIIWVQPTRHADLVWAIDQALRCEAVAAVWAHVGANLDDRDARRFQLAAETGHTPGLFIRVATTRGRPSFADVRFHVGNLEKIPRFADSHSLGRVMNVTLDRCRGAHGGSNAWVQIDDQARIHQVTSQQLGIFKDETAAVRLASELAHPKTSNQKASRQRRA
jgi:protein ImuA